MDADKIVSRAKLNISIVNYDLFQQYQMVLENGRIVSRNRNNFVFVATS